MEEKELVKQIEAILFAAARAVSKEELKSFTSASDEEIEKAANQLAQKLDETDSAIMLTPEAGGWKLSVREKFTSPLRNIVPNTELNRSVLETLAVIAWKQPVMQAEVINIRTTKAYEHIAELEELGFISRQKHGRSFVLRTSKKFNEYFDLPKQEAIKELFKDIKDESGLADDPQKKLDDTPKVEVYNLEGKDGAYDGEKMGGLDLYETKEEKDNIEREREEGPKEEFYEKADEEQKEEDEEEKSDVYVDLGNESEGTDDQAEEEELAEKRDELKASEAKKEDKEDSGRKLENELEEMLEDKKEEEKSEEETEDEE